MKTTLIDQLLETQTLWQPPRKSEPLDPAWQVAWSSASELARKNLARGWLWSVLESDTCTETIDIHMELAQKLQPYLDPDFFEVFADKHSWAYYAAFFGCESDAVTTALNPNVLAAARLFNAFFFGQSHQQNAALASIAVARYDFCYGVYNSSIRQALRLSRNKDDGAKQLAMKLAAIAGENGCLPTMDTPLDVRLLQIRSHLDTYASRATYHQSELVGTLKDLLVQQQPQVAAELLLNYIERDVVEWNGIEYIKDYSFLKFNLEFGESYPVIDTWLPGASAVLEHSHALGLSVVEACALIASGNEPGFDADKTHVLPSDLTP